MAHARGPGRTEAGRVARAALGRGPAGVRRTLPVVPLHSRGIRVAGSRTVVGGRVPGKVGLTHRRVENQPARRVGRGRVHVERDRGAVIGPAVPVTHAVHRAPIPLVVAQNGPTTGDRAIAVARAAAAHGDVAGAVVVVEVVDDVVHTGVIVAHRAGNRDGGGFGVVGAVPGVAGDVVMGRVGVAIVGIRAVARVVVRGVPGADIQRTRSGTGVVGGAVAQGGDVTGDVVAGRRRRPTVPTPMIRGVPQ